MKVNMKKIHPNVKSKKLRSSAFIAVLFYTHCKFFFIGWYKSYLKMTEMTFLILQISCCHSFKHTHVLTLYIFFLLLQMQ